MPGERLVLLEVFQLEEEICQMPGSHGNNERCPPCCIPSNMLGATQQRNEGQLPPSRITRISYPVSYYTTSYAGMEGFEPKSVLIGTARSRCDTFTTSFEKDDGI